MQNAMLINRGLNWSPRTNKDVTATITYANGRTVRGYLTSVSDFKVIIRDESGTEQSCHARMANRRSCSRIAFSTTSICWRHTTTMTSTT